MLQPKIQRWAVVGLLAAVVGALLTRRARRRSIRGKVALVTGGSRGLGLLISEELAKRGAQVVICARDPSELERARVRLSRHGGEVMAVAADLESDADIRALVGAARA